MAKFVARITRIERLNMSRARNPRFQLHLDNGMSVVTQSDAAINYGIENPEYRNVPVEFTTSNDGRVVDARPVSELEKSLAENGLSKELGF